MTKHRTNIYNSLEEYLESIVDEPRYKRQAIRQWKQHIEKNGNVPMITKCSICSGEELRSLVKLGKYNLPRDEKLIRDEKDPKRNINED